MMLELHNMQYLVNGNIAYHAVEPWSAPCKLGSMKIRLAEFRKGLGFTLEDMAERVGVSDSQLSRWETGKSSIPSKRLPELAKAYGCRVSQVFADDDVSPDDVELTADQLVSMVRLAQDEMRAGTSFADWPKAVATNLHEQLKQIQAAGGLRVSPAPLKAASIAAQSLPASKQRGSAKSSN